MISLRKVDAPKESQNQTLQVQDTCLEWKWGNINGRLSTYWRKRFIGSEYPISFGEIGRTGGFA
jgi:hypothetical protein